jgi:FkbM family methyltransferase
MATRRAGLAYYETDIGNYFLPSDAPDDIIARYMRAGRVFEPEVVEIARRYIKPGTAAIDVGANFGQMAILFSGMGAKVYAIEAQQIVYDILVKNIEANSADIIPIFKAAYTETGKSFRFPKPDFVQWGAYGSYNLPLDASEGDPVDSIMIDDIDIRQPVSFMKVDVQGCDLFAMQGAIETIAEHRMPILFEFEQRFQGEYRTSFEDYVAFTRSINYRFAETVLDINYLIVPC